MMGKFSLRALFFPPHCGICGELTGKRGEICEDCTGDLPRIRPPICTGCGREKARCTCRSTHTGGVPIGAPFTYEGSVRKAVTSFKFHGELYRAQTFAKEIGSFLDRRWSAVTFDCIVPVPMTGRGRRKRGFDPVETLARELGRVSGLPVVHAVRKRRETKPQHEMKGPKRQANVYDAYELTGESVEGKSILLLDDVITTGSTVGEIGRLLRRGGCRSICACAAALTPMDPPRG